MGVATRFVRTDVSKHPEVEALVDSAAEFGGVGVMVCNAGMTLPSDGPDVAETDYRHPPMLSSPKLSKRQILKLPINTAGMFACQSKEYPHFCCQLNTPLTVTYLGVLIPSPWHTAPSR